MSGTNSITKVSYVDSTDASVVKSVNSTRKSARGRPLNPDAMAGGTRVRTAPITTGTRTTTGSTNNPTGVSVGGGISAQTRLAPQSNPAKKPATTSTTRKKASGIPTAPTTGGAPAATESYITCPNCEGSFLSVFAGKAFSAIGGFLQRSFNIRIPTVFLTYLKEKLNTVKFNAFGGECPYCDGERKVLDTTNDTKEYQEAARIAQSVAPEIEEAESQLGTGGNRYVLVQNSEMKEIGIGMNDAPSYRIDPEAGYRLWGLSGFGKKGNGTNPKYGPIPKGSTYNHTQGLNPIAAPGGSGQGIIKCSNKFSVLAGAMGVEIVTNGPITLKGGITRISGPEVTVGTGAGKLLLEGEVVNMVGKSIEVGPTDGHFVVKGTISNTGNYICGGHAHIESASVVRLETTGKNETSKVSSGYNTYTGPAFWGGEGIEGIESSLKSLLSYTIVNSTHPEHQKMLISPRFALGMIDEMLNVAYNLLPTEVLPCGFAGIVIAGVPVALPVFLFPHTHAMPDQMHTHETRVPDIKCDFDSADELRGAQVGVDGPARLVKKQTNVFEALGDLFSSITSAAIGILVPTQHKAYVKKKI
jgi:hypothetical protein